ncbi:hypothetical protein WG66_006446 [Moniliophthora roreri]|uniref:F-box domain-containing protein n=1 Tax=Moniliophthora roreri TaxID=221103 RepID=A0A0W0G997_MONRR|nr:hypothetical protein WG66_006446 [Moniliophthora roreri]
METHLDSSNPGAPSSLSSRSLALERLFHVTVSLSDRMVVSQFLHDAEMEIKGYQTEIHKLKSAILSLEHRRDGLRQKVAKYRSLLSPIHRVPPEILRHIFTFCCTRNWLQLSPTSASPVLAISSTCSRWRENALSMPTLWSQICIRFEEWKEDYHALTSLTHLFLGRSKSSPLSLILYFEDQAINDATKPSLTALVQQSERWHSLRIWGIKQADLHSNLFQRLRGNLPILSALDIAGDPEEEQNQFHWDLLSDCPKLSSLSVQPACPITTTCVLPWHQIKTLQLYHSIAFFALPLLSLCCNAEHLELLSIGDFEGIPPHAVYRDHVTLPSIKKLSIMEVEENEHFYCIFQNSTLPRLSELELHGQDILAKPLAVRKEWDEVAIINFLSRSSCSITSLTFKWVPISDEQIIRLLRFMPHLKTLSLEEYPTETNPRNQIVTRFFLKSLLVDHEHTSSFFLPRLTNLKLVVHADSLDEHALSDAVMSRWIPHLAYASDIGVDCIKSIEVIFLDWKEDLIDTLTGSLRWMGDAGARVTIVGRSTEKGSDAREQIEERGAGILF